jgi:general secretion pathway protein D
MKLYRQIKILLSFVCITIWLIGGSGSTAWGASPDMMVQAEGNAIFVPAQPGNPAGKRMATPQPAAQPQEDENSISEPAQPGNPAGKQITSSQAATQKQAGEKKEEPERYVTIDFENVDINLFIKYISELTGKNFIIDKAVRGNVTIVSPTKISVDEAYKVFESVLEVQDFTTVEAGSVIKIVPAADARSKSIETGFKEAKDEITDKIVTQLIPLKYADPDELKKLFTPLVSKNSVVIAYPATNLLIVTDVLSNINRLLKIIKHVDVAENVSEITVIPLVNATATEVAKTLDTIFAGSSARRTPTARTVRRRTTAQPAGDETGPALGEVNIIADERTNSLIVIASAYDTEKVKSLVALLDKEIPRGSGNINVYYLQHANAEDLTKVLMALPEQTDQPQQAGEKGKAPTISKDVQIVADQATNSLVITANKADYAALLDVIKKLDIPRRMVYLEALIMEVNADKAFSVGVEWLGGFSYGNDSGIVFGGSRGADSSILPSLANPTVPKGISLGIVNDFIDINGETFPSLSAILNAYKNDDDVHIISTPQILTTDNEEAEIKVGENVPYITSQNTTASNQDYTNYEYKDVGVSLKITPQINQENVVRLQVYVEVIRLKSASVTNTPTTFKRTAQTTVIIQDSNTLVLGGIIGDDIQDSVYKIPLLGDIPGLGWLFKTETHSKSRVNLYIFLTPRIIRNPTEANAVTREKQGDAEYHHGGTDWKVETFKYKEENMGDHEEQPASEPVKIQEQEKTGKGLRIE